MESVMTFFDALFTFLFGVALPSWDVYSDLIFALTLAIPRCYDYKGYHYYEKYHNWGRKYIIFTGTFMLKQRCLKNVLFLGSSCGENDYQCPKINKCIYKFFICDNDNDCGDGSDELHCSGKGSKILSFI